MNNRLLYKSEAEARQHHAAINHLAEDLHRSELGIRPLYEMILARFIRTARIREFLSVLVSRRVRDLMDSQPGREVMRQISDFEGNRRHREVL